MSNYNFLDCKPIATLATKDLIDLEHKYRLLLKKDGFQDIEAWDNSSLSRNKKTKKIKFIKGHVRFRGRSKESFLVSGREKAEFYRVIGLYAYHCKDLPEKYREVLQDYSLTGNLAKSVRDTGCSVTKDGVTKYIKSHLPKMITFIREYFGDE